MVSEPDSVCGHQPELPEDWGGDSPLEGVHFTGEYQCMRPTAVGQSKCIWHADKSRKRIRKSKDNHEDKASSYSAFVDGESVLSDQSRLLTTERIDDAYLDRATIQNVSMHSLHFYNSRFKNAKFRDVTIELSSFTHCLFDDAEFRETTIGATFEQTSINLSEFRESEFAGAVMHDVALIGVKFYNSDFKASTFERPEFSREVLFSGCSIDHSTDFNDIQIQNSGRYEYEARAKLYGQLADLYISSRQLGQYIEYKKRERYAEGKRQRHDLRESPTFREWLTDLSEYFLNAYSRATMGYGYSMGRVMLSGAVVLLLGTILYTIMHCHSGMLDGLKHTCSTPTETLAVFTDSLYFSVVTFSSLGYGDITPLHYARFVAVWQALAGIILSAQFVYVLATKTSI